MAFKVTWNGQSWSSLELKGREVEALERALETDFAFIQPGRSMRHRMAILATFLGRSLSEDEVAGILDVLTIADLDEVFDWAPEDDLPETFEDGRPLGGAGISTGGSSGVPASTDGLPMSPEPSPSET